MLIKDKIYGRVNVDSPVLTELIRTASMQRLKRINQLGMPDEFYHVKNFSRYEHSVGVTLLLKALGASEEEQVAGLLHDVSHTALSHVYDWVISDYTKQGNNEGSQDARHVNFIKNSEIPAVLGRYGYSVDRVTDYHNFGLLERDSPDLCADRVDYALRELPIKLARQIFDNLTVYDGMIVCKNLEMSAIFGRVFLDLQMIHWGGYEAVTRYHYMAGILKRALELAIISESDFLRDDEHVIGHLKSSADEIILEKLEFLRQKPIPAVDQGIRAYKKFRHIDPRFVTAGGLLKLTQADGLFRTLLEEAREQDKKGVLVPAFSAP